ncbi:MAG: HNH endonuclease [Luteolibacter sp.]|uniref:HNH endonuclease n=1 Tax=Luteolibacter sp. TaxID=1962973 RepID=UPI0032643488
MLRNHLLAPIPELFEAAELLHQAALAHKCGDHTSAKALIRKSDMPVIFDWSESLFGGNRLSGGKQIAADIKNSIFKYTDDPEKPASVTSDQRASGTIVKQIATEVVNRDGYFCRFCGVPVIEQKAQLLFRKAYPDALRWGPRNVDKHATFQALDLDLDHILARSLGGENTLDNLVVTCAPCNCGRGSHTLFEMGLADPRLRSPIVPTGFETWDGLTLLLKR